MFHTGVDPFTKKPVHVAKPVCDRKLQRALMQFFKPENGFEVRMARIEAGRRDLIGEGFDALVPEIPPREACERRRRDANARFNGAFVHPVPTGGERKKRSRRRSRNEPGAGYRPARKSTTDPRTPR